MTSHFKPVFHILLFATLITSLLGSSLVVTPAFATGTKRYAKATGGKTSGACTTWGTACTLQRALSVAAAGNQVWVKAGVYMPTSTTDRTQSFVIKPGVKVYGGFGGTETVLTARKPKTHVTILSGDIDHNDAHHSTTNIDLKTSDIVGNNSYNVVFTDGTGTATVTASTVLDGFTITGGKGDGAFFVLQQYSGGGLFCNAGVSGKVCSPTLANMIFSGNLARQGGALFNNAYNGGTSSPSLMNVSFIGNTAQYGGAIYNNGYGSVTGISNPTLTNVTFSGNTALNIFGGLGEGYGGAMFNDGHSQGASSPTLVNVTFNGNQSNFGGAMYNGGFSSGHSSPRLTNVTFKGNSAIGSGYGGGMYNDGYSGVSNPRMANVTFYGNSATTQGGAMYNDGGSSGQSNPSLKNAILWGDSAPSGSEIDNVAGATPVVTYSDVQGGYAGTGNKNANPKLNVLGYYHSGSTKTMTLQTGSPAIDHGTNTGCTAKDQNGLGRPQDGDHNGSKVCDMGATEYP